MSIIDAEEYNKEVEELFNKTKSAQLTYEYLSHFCFLKSLIEIGKEAELLLRKSER